MTKHFEYIVCIYNDITNFHSDGTDMLIDIKHLLLKDELKILSKVQVFAGNLLCGAVCTNSFEKSTFFFPYIKDDSRNAPKLLRKTAMFTRDKCVLFEHIVLILFILELIILCVCVF